MRLLKIVAVPAAISLLLSPAEGANAQARSKILGKIQKNTLAQTKVTKGSGKDHVAEDRLDLCVDCDTPCHSSLKDNNGTCPGGPHYDPDDYHYKLPDFKKKDGSSSTVTTTIPTEFPTETIPKGVPTGFNGNEDTQSSSYTTTDTTVQETINTITSYYTS